MVNNPSIILIKEGYFPNLVLKAVIITWYYCDLGPSGVVTSPQVAVRGVVTLPLEGLESTIAPQAGTSPLLAVVSSKTGESFDNYI